MRDKQDTTTTAHGRLQQQFFMSNMIMTTREQAFVSSMRLQALGVTDMEIKNMAHLMDFGPILPFMSSHKLKEILRFPRSHLYYS